MKTKPVGSGKILKLLAFAAAALLPGCGRRLAGAVLHGNHHKHGHADRSHRYAGRWCKRYPDRDGFALGCRRGYVAFFNGSTSLGTGTLSSGTATYNATFSAAGTDTITATYGGDNTYASSTSTAVTITVSATATPTATTTTLTRKPPRPPPASPTR